MGSGCFLDAPGFPSYFIKHVYNSRGDSPSRGPDSVLWCKGKPYELPDYDSDDRDAVYRSLYSPLPIDHPRVKLWILAVARHLHHCYRDVERPEYGRPGTLIYPVPGYKLKTARIDPNWTEEYKATVQAEVDAFNKMETDRATAIATADNHNGVRTIREIYPDFQPPAWFFDPPKDMGYSPEWWECEDKPPDPGKCTGNPRRGNDPAWRHRDDNCQYCGAGRSPANPDQITL